MYNSNVYSYNQFYNTTNITIHLSTLTNPLAQTNCLSCVAMKKPAAADSPPGRSMGEQLDDLPAALSLEEKLEVYQADGAQDINEFLDGLPPGQQQAIM